MKIDPVTIEIMRRPKEGRKSYREIAESTVLLNDGFDLLEFYTTEVSRVQGSVRALRRKGMEIPQGLRYTATHEWVRVEGDVAFVGITDYAQGALGDIVYVERPPVGESYAKGDEVATIESVKAASPIYCPVSGTVTESNAALEKQPELVNKGAYDAFIFALRISDLTELEGLLDAVGYAKVVESEEKNH